MLILPIKTMGSTLVLTRVVDCIGLMISAVARDGNLINVMASRIFELKRDSGKLRQRSPLIRWFGRSYCSGFGERGRSQ